MTIVTNVTFAYDENTHILTITTTKVEIKVHASGPAQAAEPVSTVTTVDLSNLVL